MQLRPIFYDTETTGVRSEKDRVIELAAYDALADKSYVTLINPGCPIPPEATQIHKIDDNMVKDAPSFGEIIPAFVEFCGENAILIAHNNDQFDQLFLQAEFSRASVPFPSWDFIDSLKWSRKYRRDLPRHSLQHLREVYGFEANNAHRALDDVIILKNVFYSMIDDLDIATVLSLLKAAPAGGPTMPFGKYQGRPLSEVPKDYLSWLKDSGALDKPGNTSLKEAIEKACQVS